MRADGTMQGSETDIVRATGLAAGSTLTADLPLYAKFDSVSANAPWWEGLSGEQQSVFTTALTDVRDAASAGLSTPADDAAAFCGAGGVIVAAGAAGWQAFQRAMAGYEAGLDGELLARLRADRPSRLTGVRRTSAPRRSADSILPRSSRTGGPCPTEPTAT